MFTGLVQRMGVIRRLERSGAGWSLAITHDPWPDALVIGESVAVQGACLTVTALLPDGFTADLLDETLRRTALRRLGPDARVNLERALAWGGRLGGHLVSGHVDECGTLFSVETRGRDAAWRVLNALEIIDISNNLGDTKSLAVHPATTTHRSMTDEQRAEVGVTEGCIRLSVGLEGLGDLTRDLNRALDKA